MGMKKYDVYIFDLDGTITDTTAVWLNIYRDCLEHFGLDAPDDKTLAQHTHAWREMLKLGLPEEKLADFIKLASSLANERLPDAELHVGAYEVLETLKNKGKRVAIFSTMDRPIFEVAMAGRNLAAVVEIAIAGTDVEHRKPHPAGILKALSDLHIPEDQYPNCVYIGDKDSDIQAAHSAGVDAMLFFPAAHQLIYDREALMAHKPATIITDWQQLLESI